MSCLGRRHAVSLGVIATITVTLASSAYSQSHTGSTDEKQYSPHSHECVDRTAVGGGQLEVRTIYFGSGHFDRQEIVWNGSLKADYGTARASINWTFHDEHEIGTFESGFINFVIWPRKEGIRYSQWRLDGRENGTGLSIDIDRKYEGNARLNYGELRRFMAGRQRNYWALRMSSNKARKRGVLSSGYLENALFIDIEQGIDSIQAKLSKIKMSDIALCAPFMEAENLEAEI
jgi:hypothetical protein